MDYCVVRPEGENTGVERFPCHTNLLKDTFMKFKKSLFAAVAAIAMSAGFAQAQSLTGLQGSVAPGLLNPGSFTATFNSTVADAAAKLNFVIAGYKTLDGRNSYMDLFTLTINGGETYSGSFNLGGGGTSDTTLTKGSGGFAGTAVTSNTGTDIGRNGGTTTVSGLTFNLLSGNNTFKFAYSAPGLSNGNGQSIGDEGWGIKSAVVTAVPEPETYALMLAGLGLMGTIVRRRKAKQA
jgi:hypothetical protein